MRSIFVDTYVRMARVLLDFERGRNHLNRNSVLCCNPVSAGDSKKCFVSYDDCVTGYRVGIS